MCGPKSPSSHRDQRLRLRGPRSTARVRSQQEEPPPVLLDSGAVNPRLPTPADLLHPETGRPTPCHRTVRQMGRSAWQQDTSTVSSSDCPRTDRRPPRNARRVSPSCTISIRRQATSIRNHHPPPPRQLITSAGSTQQLHPYPSRLLCGEMRPNQLYRRTPACR